MPAATEAHTVLLLINGFGVSTAAGAGSTSGGGGDAWPNVIDVRGPRGGAVDERDVLKSFALSCLKARD
jgi:hypothetical protein